MFCLYRFTLWPYLFILPSFAGTFWFISSNCIVTFSSVVFSYFSRHVPAYFTCFIIFACFRSFLISISSRISNPSFNFFFCLWSLKESRFSHKLILLWYVHLSQWCFFVCVYVRSLFIFSFSILIVLHSMFLTDGKVVFCLFIILFKFFKSYFWLSYWVCSVLLRIVVFLFSEIGDSFRLNWFYLSVLGVSVCLNCLVSLFNFWGISSISRSENQPIFIIVLLGQRVFVLSKN